MLQKSVENFAENDVKFKELVKDMVREELKSYKEHNDKQIQIIFEKLQLYREDLRITYKLIQEIIELFGLHKENSELHRKKVDESLRKLQTDYNEYKKDYNEYKKDISELFKDQIAVFDYIFAFIETQKFENKVKILDTKGHPIELVEVLKKIETKFQTQRKDINTISHSLKNLQIDYNENNKDINEIFKDQMNLFETIVESLEKLEMDFEKIKEFERKFNLENKKEAKPKTKAEMWEEQKARHLNKAEKNKVEILDTKGSSDGK